MKKKYWTVKIPKPTVKGSIMGLVMVGQSIVVLAFGSLILMSGYVAVAAMLDIIFGIKILHK
jgi:energy-converting hydrogenase Eha subunit E